MMLLYPRVCVCVFVKLPVLCGSGYPATTAAPPACRLRTGHQHPMRLGSIDQSRRSQG